MTVIARQSGTAHSARATTLKNKSKVAEAVKESAPLRTNGNWRRACIAWEETSNDPD